MTDRPLNDLVPDPWKSLFTNQEWLVHGIVVRTIYAGFVIAAVAHVLVYLWQPWLQ